MRSLYTICVAILISVFFNASAVAEDCSKEMEKYLKDAGLLEAGSKAVVKVRPFFECIVNELNNLRKKQKELEDIIEDQSLLLAQIPQHFVFKDGDVTFEEGRKIGSASFVLSSRQLGGATSIELDRRVIDSVCAAPLGCSVTMTYRRYSFRGDEIVATQKTGPCRFEVNSKTNEWSRGGGCGSDTLITGKSGDGKVTVPGSGAAVIINAVPGCVLADADIKAGHRDAKLQLETDHSPAMFLIVDPAMREDGATRFECDLEVF